MGVKAIRTLTPIRLVWLHQMCQGGAAKRGKAITGFLTEPAAGNDPSKGAAYDEKADKRSWQAMKDFLKEVFGE